MGDARDTAKKKKADEKKCQPAAKAARREGGAKPRPRDRRNPRRSNDPLSHRADFPDPGLRCSTGSRQSGSGSFRAGRVGRTRPASLDVTSSAMGSSAVQQHGLGGLEASRRQAPR